MNTNPQVLGLKSLTQQPLQAQHSCTILHVALLPTPMPQTPTMNSSGAKDFLHRLHNQPLPGSVLPPHPCTRKLTSNPIPDTAGHTGHCTSHKSASNNRIWHY